MKEVFKGVYLIDDMLATRNLVPGRAVYDEKLVSVNGEEFRHWSPKRSKLSAAIMLGLEKLPIMEGSRILYLGAATGTTASHVSDIAARGRVYCVEPAITPLRKLVELCKTRLNMVPLCFDANRPLRYAAFLERVDVIYQDVAQRNQVEILLKNSELFLPVGGFILMALKARSIDSTMTLMDVVGREIAGLKASFKIHEVVDLSPFEKGHAMISAEKKSPQ